MDLLNKSGRSFGRMSSEGDEDCRGDERIVYTNTVSNQSQGSFKISYQLYEAQGHLREEAIPEEESALDNCCLSQQEVIDIKRFALQAAPGFSYTGAQPMFQDPVQQYFASQNLMFSPAYPQEDQPSQDHMALPDSTSQVSSSDVEGLSSQTSAEYTSRAGNSQPGNKRKKSAVARTSAARGVVGICKYCSFLNGYADI